MYKSQQRKSGSKTSMWEGEQNPEPDFREIIFMELNLFSPEADIFVRRVLLSSTSKKPSQISFKT